MAKFYGPIGFADPVETAPSVWVNRIVERNYSGDIINENRRLESSGGANDNITISNNISIISDAYAENHFYQMKYVEYMGTKWKIDKVDVKGPRLILILGGVYNG